MQMKRTKQELEHRRRLAVQRVKEGMSTQVVAQVLGVSMRSVQRWVKAERSGGPQALAARPYPGHPKLTAAQAARVVGWLQRKPTEFGFPTELWTGRRVAQLIERELGVSFHPRYVCAWLKRHNFSPQKPRRVPRERDPAKIDRWLQNDWSRIKKKWQAGAHLMLIDESGLMMAPLVRRSWAVRGCPPVLKHKASHRDRVSVIAALSYPPRRVRPTLYFESLPQGYYNGERAAAFVRQLLRQVRGPVIAVRPSGTSSRKKACSRDRIARATAGRTFSQDMQRHCGPSTSSAYGR